jgi:TRAP-type C4-dicarboxylate transport system permease small subunit
LATERGADPAAPDAAPADARCPRCGNAFHCGIDDAARCACTTLQLSAATLRDLRARHHGCLCMPCLRALAQEESAPAPTAAPEPAIDRAVGALTQATMPLAIVVTVLLFLQWPLRDVVHAGSTLANDLAQWLFACYVAVSLGHATHHRAHLTARGDLAQVCDPASPQRQRWRAVGAALCLLPWAAYLLIVAWPEVAQAVRSGERFPETDNVGYFMTHVAMLMLALLATWQGARDLWRALRPRGG